MFLVNDCLKSYIYIYIRQSTPRPTYILKKSSRGHRRQQQALLRQQVPQAAAAQAAAAALPIFVDEEFQPGQEQGQQEEEGALGRGLAGLVSPPLSGGAGPSSLRCVFCCLPIYTCIYICHMHRIDPHH